MNDIQFKKWMGVCWATMVLIWLTGGTAMGQDPQMTGLPELTREELQWQNRHMLKVKKVKLNRIGLERINRWRAKKGKNRLDERQHPVSGTGKELEVTLGVATTSDTLSDLPEADIPAGVDNSRLKYFPPIRSQGSLNSCGVFSGTYYAMTHMYAMANDVDVKTGGDGTQLSPKWTYNMVNGGTNSGTWYYWAYEIGQKHGVATWEEFPYDSNYRAWNLNPETWEDALYRRFDQYGYVANTHLEPGLEQVKQMLLNGYVLNIATYIYSWNWQTISDDPSTTEDDGFVGKRCVSWVNGTSGYHAMAVVGYNDDIWVDINNDQVVDPGEKGAFRIANSWGTGWGEAGYAWMSYDALRTLSAVSGGPSTGRISGWYPTRAHWVTARSGYEPRLMAEFTLNHAKRDQLRMTLGVSDIDQSIPSVTWIPEMIYNQGGAYGFSGTTTAVDGTFVFDLTDLVPSDGGLKTYYLGFQDDTAGDEAVLKSFALIDPVSGYVRTESLDSPQTIDGTKVYGTVAYDYSDGNQSPTAIAQASALSGQVPFKVSFDGSDSSDPDGSIVQYHWGFGDGTSQEGAVVDHLYETPGAYVAVLTVTDDQGAMDQAQINIEVVPDPLKIVFVSQIQASLETVLSGKFVRVRVQILDSDMNPVAGALVQGEWSGLVFGESSGTTLEDGIVEFLSQETEESGDIVFRVTLVTASGYTYDSSLNTMSNITQSIEETVNQAPVVVITATPLDGTAPLEVIFDGSGSWDYDGTIVSYEWDFGDGTFGSGPSLTYEYETAGTYKVILTVTDDLGASRSDSVNITVTSGLESSIHVSDISMEIIWVRKKFSAAATVIVMDESGIPLENVTVSGEWGGLVSGDQSGTTDASGTVRFISRKARRSGTFIFTVTGLSLPGYIYAPDENILTSGAVDTP
ncbi:PKD domain-containing protein [Desulfospira joergensenii]|uniref:PKD domain-containing protein n=1 Tax=Desulfospira joergensenii TaxID=53329 RepID=UPI0003B667E2|nr:PKD domain-containing protein [Desulfospira joergensenii]